MTSRPISEYSNFQKLVLYTTFLLLITASLFFLFFVINRLFINPRELRGLGFGDAIEYWSAFHIWDSGLNPYNDLLIQEYQSKVNINNETLMMWNPPWLLSLFSPVLSIPSFLDFARIWFISSLCAYIFGAYYLIHSIIPEYKSDFSLWILLLCFAPLLTTLSVGQIGTWLFLGTSLIIGGIINKNSGSVLLGSILLSLKPHLFLVFIFISLIQLIKTRNWKLLAFFLLGPILVAIATELYSADSVTISWIKAIYGITPITLAPSPQKWITTTIPSVISELFSPSNIAIKNYISSLFFLFSLVISFYTTLKITFPAALSISILISIPLGPFGWLYDYTILSTCIIIAWPIIRNNYEYLALISISLLILLFSCILLIQRLDQALLPLLITISILIWINFKMSSNQSILFNLPKDSFSDAKQN